MERLCTRAQYFNCEPEECQKKKRDQWKNNQIKTQKKLNLQLFKPVLTLYNKASIINVNVDRTVLFWEQTELNIAEAADLSPCLWDWAFRSGLSAWSVCWQTLSEEVPHIFTLVKPLLPGFSFFPWASAVARATCAWRTRRNVYTVYSFCSDGLYG